MSTASPSRSFDDLKQVPYALVLLTAGSGISYSVLDSRHWLRGVGVVGVALLLAGLFRLVLTRNQAGLLVVRRRTFDVACYFALGGAIIGVGLLLPH